MRRFIFALTLIVLLVSLPATLTAQNDPLTTEEPPAQATVAAPVVQPEALPTALDATPQPVSPLDPEALPVLLNVRTDLELLANQLLNGARPEGWSGSLDINNPQLPILIRLDLELLTGSVLGASDRPEGWFGAVSSSTFAIARDIRHDLELLADTFNSPGIRPLGWAGSDPVMRCSRAVQTLINLIERSSSFQLTANPAASDFCQQAEIQASQYAEVNLLGSGVAGLPTEGGSVGIPGTVRVQGEFAVAFLTRFGTQAVGTIPLGEVVTPVARSYTQFSKMVLVRGSGFEVFVDYRDTTLTDAQFVALDDIDAISVNPNCGAGWCKAPNG